jgi:hypothetical protein
MYYSSGNYEAFARPRKPERVEHKTAWFVGAGLASLAGAAFLIRDAQFPAEKITILERLKLPGGALDGIKEPKKGFVVRGGREMENHFECLWDLFRSIPSLEVEGASVLDEFYWLNKDDPNYSLQRATVNRGQDARTDGLFTLTDKAQKEIVKIFLATREEMEGKRINEVFTSEFFASNFWMYWRTMFAFEEWHSALEMKLYLHRFIHHIGGLPDFSALKFTKYNQYESLVLPLYKWLLREGVVFHFSTEVTDVDFAISAERKQASRIHWVRDGAEGGVDLSADDLLFMTIGSLTENSDNGDHDTPARLNEGPAAPGRRSTCAPRCRPNGTEGFTGCVLRGPGEFEPGHADALTGQLVILARRAAIGRLRVPLRTDHALLLEAGEHRVQRAALQLGRLHQVVAVMVRGGVSDKHAQYPFQCQGQPHPPSLHISEKPRELQSWIEGRGGQFQHIRHLGAVTVTGRGHRVDGDAVEVAVGEHPAGVAGPLAGLAPDDDAVGQRGRFQALAVTSMSGQRADVAVAGSRIRHVGNLEQQRGLGGRQQLPADHGPQHGGQVVRIGDEPAFCPRPRALLAHVDEPVVGADVAVGVGRGQDRVVPAGDARVLEAERRDDPPLDERGVRVAGDTLRDHCGQEIVQAVVLLLGTRGERHLVSRIGLDNLAGCPALEAMRGEPGGVAIGQRALPGQPAGVVQQFADGDRRPLRWQQSWQVVLHGLVKVDPVIGDELEYHRGGEDLADASDAEVAVGVDGGFGLEVGDAGGAVPGAGRTADLDQLTGHRGVWQAGHRGPQRRRVQRREYGRWSGTGERGSGQDRGEACRDRRPGDDAVFSHAHHRSRWRRAGQ